MSNVEFDQSADELMRLMPAVHQLLDARGDAGNGFLRALLGLVGEQVTELRDDLAALYDDLFIETCAPWAVPYIGDLVGVTADHDIAGIETTTRAQVANVIALRRRKGTADVVEELAIAITDWSARVVEMFECLATTQSLNHLRTDPPSTISLRSARHLELIDSAFDPFAHNIDVRWIATRRGRHNVQNIAVFLWPEAGMPFFDVEASGLDASRFRFHPVGIDTTLVTNQVRATSIGTAATTTEVPWPISIRALDADLATGGPANEALYSDSGSIFVQFAGGADVPPSQVVACSLGDLGNTWEHLNDIPNGAVAIDPRRGRLALGPGVVGRPIVSFHQTFTGTIGGGTYDRVLVTPAGLVPEIVSRAQAAAPHQTIASALTALGGDGLIVIDDGFTYAESLSTPVNANQSVEIRGANGRQPVVRAAAGAEFVCADGGSVVLDGLVIVGGTVLIRGRPATIRLRDCTLVPGLDVSPDGSPLRPQEASLIVTCDPDVNPQLVLERCITGPLLVPSQSAVSISDSIVQGGSLGTDPAERPSTALVVVSDDLAVVPALGASPNEVMVLVADQDPIIVDVGTPADLDAVVDAFAASSTVRAVAADGRAVLVGHQNESLSIRDAPNDTTASDLSLAQDGSIRIGLRGVVRPAPLLISDAQPSVALRTDSDAVVDIALGGVPNDLAAAAALLQVGIRASSGAAVHQQALVVPIDDALVVIPGEPGRSFAVVSTPADPTTAAELGLQNNVPALASDGNAADGPTMSVDRVTFLGRVAATVLEYASDSIFAEPVVASRVQQGCVRFSYLAAGSRTPRRYRCLPDHDCIPELAFRSTRWGGPTYASLVDVESVAPIRCGSSTGNEMGAFAGFQHRHRESNLRHQLDEFLRFSMEAGLLDGRSSKHVGGHS